MNDFVAYCGLNCETCEARIATVNDDDELRKKVAAEWSQLNQVEITKEMINCTGCRKEGPKTPFCEYICEIKKCGSQKKIETCGDCSEKKKCQKLSMITGNNDAAAERLGLK